MKKKRKQANRLPVSGPLFFSLALFFSLLSSVPFFLVSLSPEFFATSRAKRNEKKKLREKERERENSGRKSSAKYTQSQTCFDRAVRSLEET